MIGAEQGSESMNVVLQFCCIGGIVPAQLLISHHQGKRLEHPVGNPATQEMSPQVAAILIMTGLVKSVGKNIQVVPVKRNRCTDSSPCINGEIVRFGDGSLCGSNRCK